MDLYCLPNLAEQRLPEGSSNFELEASPVSLPLRMVLGQMLGKGVFQVSPLNAAGVLLGADVSAVSTLARINSSEILPMLGRADQTGPGVHYTRTMVAQTTTLPRVGEADGAVTLGTGEPCT